MRKRLLALMGCVGWPKSDRDVVGIRPSVECLIPVLLISLGDAEKTSVREFLRGTRFLPVCADNLDHAAKLLSQILFPIVVYDPAPHTGEWEKRVGRLLRVWRRPMLLFPTSPGNTGFPENSVCGAGIYVLPRPLDGANFTAALDLAYRSWSEGPANGGALCRAMAAASGSISNGSCGRLPGCVIASQ